MSSISERPALHACSDGAQQNAEGKGNEDGFVKQREQAAVRGRSHPGMQLRSSSCTRATIGDPMTTGTVKGIIYGYFPIPIPSVDKGGGTFWSNEEVGVVYNVSELCSLGPGPRGLTESEPPRRAIQRQAGAQSSRDLAALTVGVSNDRVTERGPPGAHTVPSPA
eukprot:767940-Hanusia_phi.AAC.2